MFPSSHLADLYSVLRSIHPMTANLVGISVAVVFQRSHTETALPLFT